MKKYAVVIEKGPNNYSAFVPDLPGCIADGATIEEAIGEARDAFKAWAMAEREDGHELPRPKSYSGQFVQRIPKSLHMQLARRAAIEGVSLNHLATTLLAQGLGRKRSDMSVMPAVPAVPAA